MPLTPLHLGPALLVALIAYPLLDLPTLLVACAVIDLEPLMVILLNLPQPLHGQYHSLTLGTLVALTVALAMHLLKPRTEPIMARLRLGQATNIRVYLVSAVLGVWMHVAMDAFVYSDLTLLYPLQVNPLLGLLSQSTVSNIGLVSYPLAVIVYLLRITLMGWMSKEHGGPKQHAPEMVEKEHEPVAKEAEYVELPLLQEAAQEQTPEPEAPKSFPEPPATAVEELEPAVEPPLVESNVAPSVYLGTEKVPRQWGIVGRAGEELVAVDLNEPHIVFVCGKQGSGKGYTIGVISEMLLSKTVPGISQVRKPATLIVFHKPREDIRSEL